MTRLAVAVGGFLCLVASAAATCGPQDIWKFNSPGQQQGCSIEGPCLYGLQEPFAMCAVQTCVNTSYTFDEFSMEPSENCEFDRFVAPFTPPGGLCGTGNGVINGGAYFMPSGSVVAYITDDDDTYPGFKLCADTFAPTVAPTVDPTVDPTGDPTGEPTGQPTDEPTGQPTGEPTGQPTGEPTLTPTKGYPDDQTLLVIGMRPTPFPSTRPPSSAPTPTDTKYPDPFAPDGSKGEAEASPAVSENSSESKPLRENPGLIIAIVVPCLVLFGGGGYYLHLRRENNEMEVNGAKSKKRLSKGRLKSKINSLVF